MSNDRLRCIFGIHANGRKPFMSKRLVKKKRVARLAGARPTLRVERARPNRYHSFLKRLQAGGRSNMYGAIPYLMSAFGVDREAAVRSAVASACAVLARGVTQSLACDQAPPRSVECR